MYINVRYLGRELEKKYVFVHKCTFNAKLEEHSLWLEIPADKKNNSTNNAFPPKQFGEEPLITIKSKEV